MQVCEGSQHVVDRNARFYKGQRTRTTRVEHTQSTRKTYRHKHQNQYILDLVINLPKDSRSGCRRRTIRSVEASAIFDFRSGQPTPGGTQSTARMPSVKKVNPGAGQASPRQLPDGHRQWLHFQRECASFITHLKTSSIGMACQCTLVNSSRAFA